MYLVRKKKERRKEKIRGSTLTTTTTTITTITTITIAPQASGHIKAIITVIIKLKGVYFTY
jgi:hypothetical protein